MLELEVGDRTRISAEVLRLGAPIDPTTLNVRQRKPGAHTSQVFTFDPGEQGTPDKPIIRTGVGQFTATLPLDRAGTWVFAFEATGNVGAYREVEVFVRPA